MKKFSMKAKCPGPLALFIFGLLVLSLLSAAQAQTGYRYERVDFPNGSQTFARGINAHGDIIGNYTDADGVGHSFLLHNKVYSNIDYPGDGGISALAINAHGDIVGGLSDADGDHGFLLRDGKFTKIDFPGASSTRAFGINNSGDITGQYSIGGGNEKSFILIDGVFRGVHVPQGLNFTRGAEDNGVAIVGDVVLSSDQSLHGFLKIRNAVQLIDPPGTVFPCSRARGINERGDIVGAFSIVNTLDECNSFPPAIGFVFHAGTFSIVAPPGSPDTFAFGMNDDGVVVGVTNKNGTIHGFKATPKND